MATGQVSSISSDNYQLIATNTTTSGTTSTFTFSGYKKLLLTYNTTAGSNQNLSMLFNGSSTGYGGGTWVNEYNGTFNVSNTVIYLNGVIASTHDGYVIIDNAAAGAPKLVNGFSNENGYVSTIGSSWNNTAALTGLVITGNVAFTAGSISLYGIAE